MKVTLQDGRTMQFAVGASLVGLRITAVTLDAEDFKYLDALLDAIKYTIQTRIITPDAKRQDG